MDPRDYSGIGDPHDSFEYTDYEIPLEARENMKQIEMQLKEDKYTDVRDVREHIDLLENLDSEITNALAIEARLGRNNITAKHDQNRARKLLAQLEQKLLELE